MVGERFDGFSGRCAEIVSLRSKLAKAALRCATGDANRRIGWGRSRWDFFRGLARRQVARRDGQIADKKSVHEGERRSICCCACAGRRWRAASRLRPIFSAGADHCPAAGSKLRHAEACAKAAARQAETSSRRAPADEAGRALSRPDVRAGLGRRQGASHIHPGSNGSAERTECRRCSTIHSSRAEFRALNARRRCGRTLRRNCRRRGRCARPSLG